MPFNILPNDLVVVLTTEKDKEKARSLSTQILTKKLAACVSCRTIHSEYWWDGKLENVEEVEMLFKTRKEKFSSLFEEIKKLHSYDLPELIYWDVKADLNYQEWLQNILMD